MTASTPDRAGAGPGAIRLVAQQFRYANRGFWRTPVAAFFTLAFPLVFLVCISLLVGDQTTGPDNSVRVTQFLTPVAIVFSAVMASYATLAIATATQREQGVLKRLHGTPLPTWAYVAGRIASAVWIATLGTVVMLAVGVLAYDVEIIGRTVPALVVTMVLGVSTFAALGLAAVALLRTSASVSAVTIGSVVLLGFVSDMFTGPVEMPAPLEITGWIFPLKHFANALSDVFNPFHPGTGFEWDNLAALAAWGVGGATMALRFFTWDPKGRGHARSRVQAHRQRPAGSVRPITVHPPTSLRLFAAQTRYAVLALTRDKTSTFFAVVFPIAVLMLLLTLYGDAVVGGQALGPVMTAGMAVYAVAVTAYVNLPESTATARDRGILKRLSGTPLPAWAFLAGRLVAAAAVGIVTAALMLLLAAVVFGISIPAGAIVPLALVGLVGVAAFAALGLGIAALAPSAKAVPAITLGTLLPLSFISDVFVFGAPAPLLAQRVAWFFPLKHFSAAASEGIAAGTVAWEHLGIMALWGLAGAVFATRLFRWTPHRRRAARHVPPEPRGEVTAA